MYIHHKIINFNFKIFKDFKMSTKVKKCKTCGTTDVSNFAPRKSVICKSCDIGNTVLPSVNVSQDIIPQQLPVIDVVSESSSIDVPNKDEKSLKSIVASLEETVTQLQEEIKKLNKLKKLFPRIFPEDNM